MNGNRIGITGSLIFCVLMVAFPSVCLTGAKNALSLWANTALPALLPFFICANFMVTAGVPGILGRAMEPVITRIFRVPGEAGFAFIMSITSGYPVGAKIVADLRKQGVLTRVQAEKTVSFCSTSGPLFMLGAVGAGMFFSPRVGWVIALSHYTGAIINGILYGRIYREERGFSRQVMRQAQYHRSQGKDTNRSQGSDTHRNKNTIEMLSDAIIEAIKTLLIICGYMVLFLILIEVLKMSDIGNNAIFHGFLEMTIGCNEVSAMKDITLITACILCTGIVSWGGLSVQAQALSFLSKTDIRPGRYLASKVTHMLFAAMAAVPFSMLILNETVETWTKTSELWEKGQNNFIYHFLFSSSLLIVVVAVFCVLSMISPFFTEREKNARKKRKEAKITRRLQVQEQKALKQEEERRLNLEKAAKARELKQQKLERKEYDKQLKKESKQREKEVKQREKENKQRKEEIKQQKKENEQRKKENKKSDNDL